MNKKYIHHLVTTNRSTVMKRENNALIKLLTLETTKRKRFRRFTINSRKSENRKLQNRQHQKRDVIQGVQK